MGLTPHYHSRPCISFLLTLSVTSSRHPSLIPSYRPAPAHPVALVSAAHCFCSQLPDSVRTTATCIPISSHLILFIPRTAWALA